MDFAALGLDARVARAAAKRFALPTAVQAEAIPLALAGKDVIAQAATGSGKTLAYLLPCLHTLLTTAAPHNSPGPRALVLVPTRELCQQVRDEAVALAAAAGGLVRVAQLPGAGAAQAALAAAAAAPQDVLVATPARVALALRDNLFRHGSISRGLQLLVLDEADLLLSFGHEADVAFIASKLPRGVQAMLVSATCSGPGIERLQKLLLTDPAIVSVPISAAHHHGGDRDGEEDGHTHGGSKVAAPSTVVHTVLRCPPKDKLLYVLALLRLGKVKRKALIFAPHPNAAVRLRLFLERFGVRCATAHGELPAASRQLALAQFNRGLFDFLIVADDDAKHRAKAARQAAAEAAQVDDDDEADEEGAAAAAEAGPDGGDVAPSDPPGGGDDTGAAQQKRGKKQAGLARDAEYGLVRGIDFKDVRTVINLDVPPDAASYVHRVGRCARGPGGSGMALTLCSPGEEEGRLEGIAGVLTTTTTVRSSARQAEDGEDGAPGDEDETPAFTFQAADVITAEAVEALRYRAEDALRGLGASAVREARLRELRSSLLGSERLAAHFEAHPHDRRLLQADAPLSKTPSAPHLKHLPSYLRTGGAIKGPADRGGGAQGKKEEARKKPVQRLDTSDVAAAGSGQAPALAEASNLSKLLWAKEDGAKVSRKRKAKDAAGPEWPQQRKALAHQRTKRNVRRGRRKTDR